MSHEFLVPHTSKVLFDFFLCFFVRFFGADKFVLNLAKEKDIFASGIVGCGESTVIYGFSKGHSQ